MQVKRKIRTSPPESKFDKDLEQGLADYTFDIAQVLNNGIRFEDNINCQIVTISDTGAADTENTVSHTLKRVPTGFIMIKNDKAGVVYDSGTAWTTTAIYVKCSIANCAVKLAII